MIVHCGMSVARQPVLMLCVESRASTFGGISVCSTLRRCFAAIFTCFTCIKKYEDLIH